MAVSTVTLNHANIRQHFSAAPLSGTVRGSKRGLSRGDADAIAARMALEARINAAKFNQRTTSLVTSVVPVVRVGRSGQTEVGVGTRVEHGKWLEVGTREHIIRSQRPFDRSKPKGQRGYLLRSNTPKWIALKGVVPDGMELERAQNAVFHPGNIAFHWMSDAVRLVLPGARVRVRVYK